MDKMPKDIKKKSMNYMKYAGLGTQMAVLFFIGIYGGKKLDVYLGNERPIITILLTLFLFVAVMVKLYKELS